MTDELIEQVARALARSLAWDVENDVYAGELTHEERLKVASAALAAINLPAQLEAARKQGWNEAIEAAATVAPSKTAAGECETVGQWTRRTMREAIRALTKENSDASSD